MEQSVGLLLPDQEASVRQPDSSVVAAAVAAAAATVEAVPVELMPGWPGTVKGYAAATELDSVAFAALGNPVIGTAVAAAVVVVGAESIYIK